MPCSGRDRAVGVALDEQAFALEAGGIRVEAEVDHGFDPFARPLVGPRAGQLEPGGPPRSAPRTADGERFEMIEVGSGLDRQRPAVRVDERKHALPQLALDALLDQVPVVVHTPGDYSTMTATGTVPGAVIRQPT